MDLFWIRRSNLGIALFPKAASVSISEAIPHEGIGRLCQLSDFQACPRRFAFWRDPAGRLESSYRYHSGGPHRADGSTFSDWVLKVCSDIKGDQMVVPQSELLNGLDAEPIRWDFARLEALLGVKVAHSHRSDHAIETQWTDEAHDVFTKRFVRDLLLFAG
jgi:hypothetical protein